MAKRTRTPSITQSDFDTSEKKLRAALRKWWDDEAQDFDAAVSKTNKVWQTMMPEIDSKAVVKASPIIKRFLGTPLDPRLIKKGGYASFDDLVKDLLPKLRKLCPVGPAQPQVASAVTGQTTKVTRSVEKNDVRRS